MATDMADDHEMREAQRDYLDFLDDDVSWFAHAVRMNAVTRLSIFTWTLLVAKADQLLILTSLFIEI